MSSEESQNTDTGLQFTRRWQVSRLALVSCERVNLRGGARGPLDAQSVPSSGRLGHTKLETMFPLSKKRDAMLLLLSLGHLLFRVLHSFTERFSDFFFLREGGIKENLNI